MNQFFALLDIGGTDIKSCVGDAQELNLGKILRTATPPNISKQDNHYEISPNKILQEVVKHINHLESVSLKINGLLISGQMGSWILTDEKNRPLTNVVSWQDNRVLDLGLENMDNMRKQFGDRRLIETGNELRPGLPIFGIQTILKDWDQDQSLRIHSLISWVASQICKEYSFSVHITDAASTGAFNLKSKNWEKEFIESESTVIAWPLVSDTVSKIGFSKNLNCEVFTSVGDQQASLHGAGLSLSNIVVNIGTGGQVAAIRNLDLTTTLQTRPYFFGKFIQTRTHLPGGRAISNYVRNLYPEIPLEKGFNKFEYESETYNTSHLISPVLEGNNLFEKNLNSQEIPGAIANGISAIYRSAINELSQDVDSEIVFAGGIGQKMQSLQKRIHVNNKFKVAPAQETTLQGLILLAQDFVN
jgi:xylulokinase